MIMGASRAEGLFTVASRMRAGAYTLTTSNGHRVLSRRRVRVG
jgi:hypothetical protein